MRLMLGLLLLSIPVFAPAGLAAPDFVTSGFITSGFATPRFVTPHLTAAGFTPAGVAAVPGAQTLGARLEIARVPGLEILSADEGAAAASYTVRSSDLQAVTRAVEAHLLTQGWAGHPNVSEPPAPQPGLAQRLRSFVQGGDLLELRTSETAQRGVVGLQLTLITLEAPPQVATAP